MLTLTSTQAIEDKSLAWIGLAFSVAGAPRPQFRVELAQGHRIRLVAQSGVLLWARVASGYKGVAWLRGSTRTDVLAPLAASARQTLAHAPASDAWFSAWAHAFVTALLASPCSPLLAGSWELLRAVDERVRPPHGSFDVVRDVENATARGLARRGFETWWHETLAILPSRALSQPSDGRVKAWRKRARERTMPPILLLFVTGLTMYVVLDGHDRLAAALLEGIAPPLLSLQHVCAWPPRATSPETRDAAVRNYLRGIDHVRSEGAVIHKNIDLLIAFGSLPGAVTNALPKTRAFPLPGAAAAWDAEVRERLAALGEPDDDFFPHVSRNAQRT